MSEPQPVHTRQRPTWRQCNNIVFLVMVIGMGLTVLWPMWLAPPLLAYTALIYLLLSIAWLPTLMVCALLRPTGERHIVALLVGLGILGVFVVMAVVGPHMSVWTFTPTACQREVLRQGLVRYTCKQSQMFGYQLYVLEGSEGSPFARLIEENWISTG
jgi:hypothetical protein